MDTWMPGQSGNPSPKARAMRLGKEHTVQKLARAIGRERVAFPDEDRPLLQEDAERQTYTRLERLVRVLWTMALGGDKTSIRCLLEYMEGKPASQEAEPDREEDGALLTPAQMAQLLNMATAKVEAWEAEKAARAAEAASETEPLRTREPDRAPGDDQSCMRSG